MRYGAAISHTVTTFANTILNVLTSKYCQYCNVYYRYINESAARRRRADIRRRRCCAGCGRRSLMAERSMTYRRRLLQQPQLTHPSPATVTDFCSSSDTTYRAARTSCAARVERRWLHLSFHVLVSAVTRRRDVAPQHPRRRHSDSAALFDAG
jgi:hypothetical protein